MRSRKKRQRGAAVLAGAAQYLAEIPAEASLAEVPAGASVAVLPAEAFLVGVLVGAYIASVAS